MTPLSPGRYGFQGTWSQEAYDLYNKVRALLAHEVPSGEVSQVLEAAMKIAKTELEKRKFGATDRPSRSRPTHSSRHIPAAVKRAVHERDGGRCTHVAASGKRCEETRFLQYDHIEPVARGGRATVDNTRLRCAAHNAYEAERTFGAEFMSRKREEAKRKRREVRGSGRATPAA